MSSRALAGVFVIALAGRAHAEPEPWPDDDPSALRLVAIAGATILHYVTDYVVEDRIAPERCRWCKPPSFDANLRDHVVWDDRKQAARLSDATAYLITPMIALGLFAVSSREARCPGRRLFRDAIPIIESALYTQLVTQVVKYSVGRQRPAVHFDGSGTPSSEDNLSFYSGHTTLAFSVAISSSFVAHRRGYRLAPAILLSTLAVGAATAYLRMAADRHYASDVLVGALAGTAGGYLIPQLGARLDKTSIVPSPDGIAIVGGF